MASLERILLAFPSLLKLSADETSAHRSWNQIATIGEFTSNRYGKFEITKADLAQMVKNFNEVTPKAPTELPVDYDHLSMEPKKPGDGVAAGWFKKLELRNNDSELWGEIEWTPDGADSIAKKAYRFISPSFVKDHTHKNGQKIGCCLLAAAVTNHPFLEGMKALTLYNFAALGDLALATTPETAAPEIINLPFASYENFDDCVAQNGDKDDPKAFCGWLKNKVEGRTDKVDIVALTAEYTRTKVVHLAEVGQRVMIAPGEARSQDEVGGTFEVATVVGDGDDSFVTLKDANGQTHKWFRSTELLPASSTPQTPNKPPLQPGDGTPPADGAAGAQGATGAEGTPGEEAAETPGQEAGEVTAGQGDASGASPITQSGHTAGDLQAVIHAVLAALKAQGVQPAKPAAPAPDQSAQPDDQAAQPAGAQPAGAQPSAGNQPPKPKQPPPFPPKKKPKGIANMMFTLRNDKTKEEFQVTDEQLEKAGIKYVPDGAVAVPSEELSELKGKVTNLSSQLAALKTEAEQTAKTSRQMELTRELERLSKAGLILKTTRDELFELFKDATDLDGFRKMAKSFTKPVVDLNTEHGSGGDDDGKPNGVVAQERLITLSRTLMKEEGMSMRDATLEAGRRLAGDVEAYREHINTPS